jgi:photosystem II stability/assembly factor-like uncharacterized protein
MSAFHRIRSFAIAALLFGAAQIALAQTPASAGPKLKGVWEPVNYSEDLQLTDVFFVTPEIGYVAGAAGTILKTTDAGSTWTALLGGDPQSQERAITQLWFVTPTVGWAAQVTSTQTNLFRTADGETWARVGVIPEHYEDFAFSSESDGVYVNDTEIFRTRNSGKTWSKVGECSTKAEVGGLTRQVRCNLWKLRFASPTVAYALGQAFDGVDAAVVMKSDDAGASWSVLTLIENENASEGGLFFTDERTGYLSTKYAKAAYRTMDGGRTWTGMPATTTARRIIFADPEVGWALHFDQLSYTTDGGRRWASRQVAFPAMPNAFSLPRRDVAYAVGDHGMIYRYRVLPETAAVAAKAIPAVAMPPLANGVIQQLVQVDSRLAALKTAAEKGGAAAADWMSANATQLNQLEGAAEVVATGLPELGRKHRNLNLLSEGLKILGDLTGQGSGMKEAIASLRQAKDLNSISVALTGMHTQVAAAQTSVQSFQTSRKSL